MSTAAARDPEAPAEGDGWAVKAADGHRFRLLLRTPQMPRASLLWLPALGVAARHYLPFAEALSARGVAVFVHEWRGHGSSTQRAGRHCDWGYRELLDIDAESHEFSLKIARSRSAYTRGDLAAR